MEKEIIKSSIGVKKLHKVVTKIYGNLPVFPIFPELIPSTDDTVKYFLSGKIVTIAALDWLIQKKKNI